MTFRLFPFHTADASITDTGFTVQAHTPAGTVTFWASRVAVSANEHIIGLFTTPPGTPSSGILTIDACGERHYSHNLSCMRKGNMAEVLFKTCSIIMHWEQSDHAIPANGCLHVSISELQRGKMVPLVETRLDMAQLHRLAAQQKHARPPATQDTTLCEG